MTEHEAFEQHLMRAYADPVGREMGREIERQAWDAGVSWLRSKGEPAAWMTDKDDPMTDASRAERWLKMGMSVTPLYLAPQPAIPDGHVIAPAFRGYAVMGAGEYMLDCCPPDEYGPSLVIGIATEEEKVGRVVGDLRDPIPGKLIQPEVMAIRIDFLTVAGLDALEQQLRILRADYFTDPETGK